MARRAANRSVSALPAARSRTPRARGCPGGARRPTAGSLMRSTRSLTCASPARSDSMMRSRIGSDNAENVVIFMLVYIHAGSYHRQGGKVLTQVRDAFCSLAYRRCGSRSRFSASVSARSYWPQRSAPTCGLTMCAKSEGIACIRRPPRNRITMPHRPVRVSGPSAATNVSPASNSRLPAGQPPSTGSRRSPLRNPRRIVSRIRSRSTRRKSFRSDCRTVT